MGSGQVLLNVHASTLHPTGPGTGAEVYLRREITTMRMNHLFIGCATVLATISHAQTWSALGDGVRGRVAAMAEYNGELYVSGQGFFSTIDQIGIVKWNGTGFEALPGLSMFGDHRIEAMAVDDGYLYVGGAFESTSGPFGAISEHVARWDGNEWSTVGDGFDNVVYALYSYNGDLHAGGDFELSPACR